MFHSKIFLLLIFFGGLTQTALLVSQEEESDNVFAKFLHQKMGENSNWVTRNQYDPSPRLVKHVSISSTFAQKVALGCNITDQLMLGHSDRTTETLDTKSDFENHLFIIMRSSSNIIEISANLSCSGNVNAEWYPEDGLKEDIPFNGPGALTFWIWRSTEICQMHNVGITVDHKLNLNQSYYYYEMQAISSSADFQATWNDSRLQSNPYASDIENEIKDIYKGFLRFDQPQNQVSPPFQLLETYVVEIAQDLDLKDVLAGVSLPDPYNPPPFTTTTTITQPPSTTTTIAATRPISTTAKTSTDTTKAETTERSEATNLLAVPPFIRAMLPFFALTFRMQI